jgi:heme-degrading monooxygenase HmoA
MISRYWSGRTRTEDIDAYVEYVRNTGIATQRATEGNLGSMIWINRGPVEAEMVVVSFWESLDAVRRFAGPEPEVAVFYPDDEQYLVEADQSVTHYEIPAFSTGLTELAQASSGDPLGAGSRRTS